MNEVDRLVSIICDEIASAAPKDRLKYAQHAAMTMMEVVGYDLARNHNSTDAMIVFTIAAEFEKNVTLMREEIAANENVIDINSDQP